MQDEHGFGFMDVFETLPLSASQHDLFSRGNFFAKHLYKLFSHDTLFASSKAVALSWGRPRDKTQTPLSPLAKVNAIQTDRG